jgi:formate-dependent nitrite reductase membrane component NrfD
MLERSILPRAICVLCGKTAGRPWWSIFTIIPMMIGFLIAPILIDSAVNVAYAATFMTMISCILDLSFVPLLKK